MCNWRLAEPAATLTVTGSPIGVVPLRMVKVSVPSSTVPPVLVMVALRVMVWSVVLKVVVALVAAVVVAAAPTVSDWLVSRGGGEIDRAVVDGLDDVGSARSAAR